MVRSVLERKGGDLKEPTIILAGGRGTRLGDLSRDEPKPMVYIDDQPILWHIMMIYAKAGYQNFIVCLGYKSHLIRDYFRTLHERTFDVEVNFTKNREEVRRPRNGENRLRQVILAETGFSSMTGARVKAVERYVDTPFFLLTYGDGVADLDIAEVVRFHLSHGKLGTLTAVHPPARFGELFLDGDQVVDFGEKRHMGTGRINGGFMVFKREIFDYLEKIPSCNLEADVLPRLVREGELRAFLHDGYWQCMDTPRDVEFLREMCAKGERPWLDEK